jgi:hypothetical protein
MLRFWMTSERGKGMGPLGLDKEEVGGVGRG